MKTKVKHSLRTTLSIVLSISMVISCMMIGTITKVNAAPHFYDYGGTTKQYIYYDDSLANISSSGSKNVYMIIGHSNYSRAKKMSRIANSTLYWIEQTYNWPDSTGFAFAASSSKSNATYEGSTSLANRKNEFDASTNTYEGNFDFQTDSGKKGQTYYIKADSSKTLEPTYIETGGDKYSLIKNDITLSTKRKLNGGSYTDYTDSTNLVILRIKAGYWNGKTASLGTTPTTDYSKGSVKYGGAVPAVATTFSYESLNSNYQFDGYYDSSGTALSANPIYQPGQNSNITYYGYISEKTHSVAVKRQLASATATSVSTKTIGNITAISVSADAAVTSNGATYDFDHWLVLGGAITVGSNSYSSGSTALTNRTINVKTAADGVSLTAVYKSRNTALSAPTNVKLNNAANDCTVNTTTVGAKIRLSWDKVTNAGSYEVYKGSTLVTTVSTLYYDIERAYSSSGTYTVVAVPTDTNSYSSSSPSTGRKLTVNKTQLNTPTSVTVTPTDIKSGATVSLTFTDSNTAYTASQFNYYYHVYGGSLSVDNAHKVTAGSVNTITPDATATNGYGVCAYPVNGSNNDYYTQSYSGQSAAVNVYSAPLKITGDLVGSSDWSYNGGKEFTGYTSNGVFTYTTSSLGSGDHYFKLYDKDDNGYSGSSTQNTNTVVTIGDKYTLTKNNSMASFQVNGSGIFVVFYDTVNNQLWVTKNTWVITPHAYYKEFNLATDSYNAATEGTKGGTINPSSEKLVTKNTSTTLEATAADGYTFEGWYKSTTFTDDDRVSTDSSYTFTPLASGDYYALFKQTEPKHYTLSVANAANATVTATYNGTTLTEGSGTKNVPVGATVTVTITLDAGCQLNSTNPSGLKAGTSTFTMPAANTAVTVNASKKNYTLTAAVSPNYGTLKFYSDAACTKQITTATYQQTFYAKYTSADGYILHDFSISGTGTTGSKTSDTVGTFKMGTANVTITANVILQYSVKYYVDMHGNTVSSSKPVQVAIVTNQAGTSVKTDSDGNLCSATLTQEKDSTVYSATINTPLAKSGTGYSALYFKISYNGESKVSSLNSNQIGTLINNGTKEIWLEAVNETSQPLKLTYATNSASTVANGYRRIYLAKPYSWQSSETAWENIGIYHWGSYTDIGWNNGIHMDYLGYDSEYHYYYADIPKTIDSNKVSNIIFQGWGSKTTAGDYSKAQTGNIENIADSANYFVLSKSGNSYDGKAGDEVVIPNYTRSVSAAAMNVGETSTINIAPTYTGAGVKYTSGNNSIVTVDANGNITPKARGTTTVKVKIYGTVGSRINGDTDCLSYDVAVTVKDPSKFEGFNIMSLEHAEYTVSIPTVGSNQPGYFDLDNVVATVSGLAGDGTYTNSAIIAPTATVTVDGAAQPTAFTVKYAKSDSTIDGYSNIKLTGTVVTKSIRRTGGQRYGFKEWKLDNNSSASYTSAKRIESGVETATTTGMPFTDSGSTTFKAIFESYAYVDVTFVYDYYEYKPNVAEDGMTEYPYDADYAGVEDRNNAAFNQNTHNHKAYEVKNYEVRDLTAATITPDNLLSHATQAIEVLPDNNYYKYTISAATMPSGEFVKDTANYTAKVYVHMTHQKKTYSVYLNGSLYKNGFAYQEYAEPKVTVTSKWYAVDNSGSTPGQNDPILATGTSYKFRVKGDTYLRTEAGSLSNTEFNRSEVDFSHYEVTHKENASNNMVEYLLQNFYIADFFDKNKVIDPNSASGLPYDDATFVGGGVVYYSMKDNKPNSNTVDAGFVDNNGVANADAIKAMLKSRIEENYSSELAAAIGEEDAMKVAYGTEIGVQQNVENGIKTGVIYRYLPLETYSDRDENGIPNKNDKGNYITTLNSNTFRYSNALQSYQYVYASGNENKSTNNGRNMRLYSYYIYSYLTYDQDTNLPQTKYEIVLSDQYADASTYWAGTTN